MAILADLNFGDSLQQGLDTFFDWLPNLVAAFVILLLGYVVARVVAGIVRRVADRTGLDRRYERSESMGYLHRFLESPAYVLGRVTFWLLFLVAVSWSLSALDSDAVDGFVAAVWNYVPHVLAALAIFVVAAAISAGVAALARRTMGDTSLGKIVQTAAPVLVMTIATFMILTELQLAESIVMITYAALVGAIALGSALAFGLGGREVAARMLEGAYRSGQESRERFRRDLEQGREQARRDTERVRSEARSGNGAGEPRDAPGRPADAPIGRDPAADGPVPSREESQTEIRRPGETR